MTATSPPKETNYYPFGLTQQGYNNLTTSLGSAGAKKYLYNGKELQEDFGLDWYDYGARFYDASLGRWFVVDPLAEKYYSNSPYHFSGNNPIVFLDKDGMEYNPIYNEEGNLIGTDDLGLQGEAIIMDKEDFKQGMSHSEALKRGTLRSELPMVYSQDFLNKIDNNFRTLPSRPDWDGSVTFLDALDWYHKGEGKPLYIDESKLNFKSSNLSVSDFGNNKILSVNFFNLFNTHPSNKNILYRPSKDVNLSYVYGTLGIILKNPSNGIIKLKTYTKYKGGIDRFDFNISLFKFIADEFGNGNPTPFIFFGYGNGKINTTKK